MYVCGTLCREGTHVLDVLYLLLYCTFHVVPLPLSRFTHSVCKKCLKDYHINNSLKFTPTCTVDLCAYIACVLSEKFVGKKVLRIRSDGGQKLG